MKDERLDRVEAEVKRAVAIAYKTESLVTQETAGRIECAQDHKRRDGQIIEELGRLYEIMVETRDELRELMMFVAGRLKEE